ncbi:hypothetical protein ABVK25_000007 [Lepraria finkii]|uniref:Pyrroline-5-carboxylate reductase n=1 Tax=Lepraria finkii TaxID=1340010 RepID=A0ABR4BNY3_9LECA
MAVNVLCLNITFLGCGKLGSAVLEGILSSLSEPHERFIPPSQPFRTKDDEPTLGLISVVPEKILACVHQQRSADSLKEKFGPKGVTVLANENVRGVEQAHMVVLGVEPSVFGEVLAEPGMRDALSGKFLISVVGGVSIQRLEAAIYGSGPRTEEDKERSPIIRVIPSTAAAVRESFTLILEEKDHRYRPEFLISIYSLFSRIGTAKLQPDSHGHIAATLAASSPAFFASALEGAVNGAIELGMEREEALEMTAAAMRGAAALMASGESPGEVARKIATPGGSTAAGLEVLRDGGLTTLMQDAVVKTASKVGGLGEKK